MDLFDFNRNEESAKPLAERMRANSLEEFIGQKHIVAEGSLLRRAIAIDRLGSCIFCRLGTVLFLFGDRKTKITDAFA